MNLSSRKILQAFHSRYGGKLAKKFWFMNNSHPICLVAHSDTVNGRDTRINVEINGELMTRPNSVLGADDRAGIYIIDHILRNSSSPPSILICDGEEKGGIGAKAFCDAITQEELFHINLLVELDRKEANQYVVYSRQVPEVSSYIESFGFVSSWGTFSDVAIITRTTQIPHVNLSVGYYSQHTSKESLHLDELNLTMSRVKQILSNPITQRHTVPTYTTLLPLTEEEKDDTIVSIESAPEESRYYYCSEAGTFKCIFCDKPFNTCKCDDTLAYYDRYYF